MKISRITIFTPLFIVCSNILAAETRLPQPVICLPIHHKIDRPTNTVTASQTEENGIFMSIVNQQSWPITVKLTVEHTGYNELINFTRNIEANSAVTLLKSAVKNWKHYADFFTDNPDPQFKNFTTNLYFIAHQEEDSATPDRRPFHHFVFTQKEQLVQYGQWKITPQTVTSGFSK